MSQRDETNETAQIEIIAKLNNSYLPSNYQADKILRKIITLVKSREELKFRDYQHHGARNSILLV